MADNNKYHTDENGVTRIKPCETMVIGGVIRGAGTVIKLESKPIEKEVV